MPHVASHPTPEQLQAFSQGYLAEPEFSQVEEHVSGCDTCCAWMERQPDTQLVALAREAATLGVESAASTRAALGAGPQSPAGDASLPAALVDHSRYRVLERIGGGGMGTVYRAEHRLMQRIVALKIIHPRLVASEQAIERFRREVRVAAQLVHPHIVASYDADQTGDLHFLVMEHVAGESLAEKIASGGPAPVATACDWIRQAALGLEHAHARGMVHRDIKPQNLMLSAEGQVKILDFGLSRVAASADGAAPVGDPSLSPTHTAMILGTPDYIAPEQVSDSRGADFRADLYSLGCTMFYLLAGRAPYAEGSTIAKLHAHESAPFPAIETLRHDVPAEVAKILARMTAKRLADRHASAGEVARELEAVLTRLRHPSPAAPVPPPLATPGLLPPAPVPASRETPSWSSWLPAWPGMGLAAGLAGLLVVAWLMGPLLFGLVGGMVAGTTGANPTASRHNAAGAGDGTPRVLVVMPSQGLWGPDYEGLVTAASATGAELVFANRTGQRSVLLHTSPAASPAEPQTTVGPDLHAREFDAIVFIGYDVGEYLPGGPGGAEVQRLLAEFDREGKITAALCGGQRVLAQHGALRGRRVAPSEALRPDEIEVEGGSLGQSAIEIDHRVVTAGAAPNAREFLEAIGRLR